MELPDDDPQAVRLMIHYFYHLDYPHVSLYDASLEENLPERRETNRMSSPDNAMVPGDGLEEPIYDVPSEKIEAEPASEPVDDVWSGLRKKSKRSKKEKKGPRVSNSPVPLWRASSPISLPGTPINEVIQEPNLVLHAEVYALAEKYGIEGLKYLALEKFGVDSSKHWNTEDFLQAAKVVYTSTIDEDRAMRDVVIKTFHEHKALLSTQLARNFLRDIEGLAYDLLLRVWDGTTWR